MTLRCFLIILALIFGSAALAFGQSDSKEEFVNLYRILDSGNCDEIDRMLAHSNSKASLLASKAECHFRLGQPAQARESLLASLGDPSISIATFFKAHGLLYQMKLYEDGVRTASEFIDSKRFLFEAYNRRSIGYTALGKYELAVEDMLSAAKIAQGKNLDRGLLIEISNLKPTDERLPKLYRRIHEGLKPVHDAAVNRRNSIPPAGFVSPEILTTIQSVGFILRNAASQEARMYDTRGFVAECEQALDKMVMIEPRFIAYGMRAAFYKGKGLVDRAKESTTLMYFYLTDETSREINSEHH